MKYTASQQPQWSQVTGQTQAPIATGDGPDGLYETLGDVQTLMHVGHDGLGEADAGALGPDITATARTIGWGGAAVWAYATFVSKDKDLASKAMPFALGGWLGSFLL